MKKINSYKGFLALSCLFILGIAYATLKAFTIFTLFVTYQFEAPFLSPKKLADLRTDSYVLMDAREIEEFNVSHIVNANHIGFKQLDWVKVKKLLSPKKQIIVYCSVGYRSGQVAEALRKQGYEAFNLRGGLFAWSNEGRPLVDNEGQFTEKIHGYNPSWGRWLTSEEVVYH